MKKEIIVIVLLGQFFFPALGQHPFQDQNWQLIFEDNFSSFENTFWLRAHNFVQGDGEHEHPQVHIQDNVYVENGKLVLRTKKQKYPCTKQNCIYNGEHDYTSGYIRTKKTYRYGYFEIYAKLPASDGYHPAFWLWNDYSSTTNCWYNEIDVFEITGSEINTVESRFHWGFECPKGIYGSSQIGFHTCNYSTGYHWYGVEWDSKKITWYIDRKPVRQISNNMQGVGIQNPMFIIMNVAMRNKLITNNTKPLNYMYVEQINEYQLKCDKNTIVTKIPNFDTYNYAVKQSISLDGTTTIPAGKTIYLKATDFIELKPGFEVQTGRELYLDVTPCENTASNVIISRE
jgi:beta-glucanase (GH16 family)